MYWVTDPVHAGMGSKWRNCTDYLKWQLLPPECSGLMLLLSKMPFFLSGVSLLWSQRDVCFPENSSRVPLNHSISQSSCVEGVPGWVEVWLCWCLRNWSQTKWLTVIWGHDILGKCHCVCIWVCVVQRERLKKTKTSWSRCDLKKKSVVVIFSVH